MRAIRLVAAGVAVDTEIYHIAVKLTPKGPTLNLKREPGAIATLRESGALVFTREQAVYAAEFLTIASAGE